MFFLRRAPSALKGLFCFALLCGLSLHLWGCGECRHDADCESGLCVDGTCELPKRPPPPPPQECITGEQRVCYSGPEGTANRGICKSGNQICTGGTWSACKGEVKPEGEEKCDKIDNNCDGKVDEGCNCQDGNTQSCYTGTPGTRNKGDCREGLQTCADGVWGTCLKQVLPQAEKCDNQDNDCNGLVDDGVSKKCQNKCGIGEEVCKAGKFEPCNAPTPTLEQCGDGKDNDCDGTIDEGCECTPNKVRQCYSGPQGTDGQGPCQKGAQTCSADGKWQDCKGQVLPKLEVCNNRDDNCNGKIDDEITQPCTRGCNSGKEYCQAGQWKGCNAVPADPEVCDGKDNDCNGKTDDLPGGKTCECRVGQSEACYGGPQGTLGRGECKSGTRTCQSTGKWSICLKQVLPSVEDCDGKDNDCDGRIDNKKGSSEGLTKGCYSGPAGTAGKGICTQGTQRCTGGSWTSCAGEIKPGTETCDNKDNDCNGKVDDGLDQVCYTGSAGTDGKGVCKKGKKSCTQGVWSSCTGEVTPSPERCNQKDDDCDGATDEDGVCNVCNSGQTQSCYTGPSNTRGRSPCKDGTSQCVSGQWGACIGEVKPATETCNNKDDDCNGQTDDGITRPCTSACGNGTELCRNGSYVNCNAPQPKTEVCNAKDDDCNGKIDDGLQCAVLATGDWSGNVFTWNPYSHKKLQTMKQSQAVQRMAFSPDRKLLAIGSVGKIDIRDASTGTSKGTLTHSGKVRGVAFSPDSKTLVTGTDAKTVILWNATTRAKIRTLTHSFTIRSVAYHPQAAVLAVANGNRITFWNPNTGSLLRFISLSYTPYTIDINKDGKSMLISGTTNSVPKLELWNISSTPYTRSLSFSMPSCQVVAYHTTFSPDGSRATASCPDVVYVWDVKTQQKQAEIKLSNTWFYGAALTPDNKTLAISGRTGSSTYFLKIYDLSTATPALKFTDTTHHTNYPYALSLR